MGAAPGLLARDDWEREGTTWISVRGTMPGARSAFGEHEVCLGGTPRWPWNDSAVSFGDIVLASSPFVGLMSASNGILLGSSPRGAGKVRCRAPVLTASDVARS